MPVGRNVRWLAKVKKRWTGTLDQLPPTMDYDPRHWRTYMYFKGESLDPFGFGLSYTTANAFPANAQIVVSFGITNSGTRAGDEVVQLYVKHSESNEELKGFQRISLRPGETKTVKLPSAAKLLAHFDEAQGTSVVLEETRHLADRQFIGGYPAGTEDRSRVRE